MASSQHYCDQKQQRQQQQQQYLCNPPPSRRRTIQMEDKSDHHHNVIGNNSHHAINKIQWNNSKMPRVNYAITKRQQSEPSIKCNLTTNDEFIRTTVREIEQQQIYYYKKKELETNNDCGGDDNENERMAVPLPPVMSDTDCNGTHQTQFYKLVLTGGPCGGKTTGQERLATYFEGLGWKVFTVPETASILLNGRIRFQELDNKKAYQFQKDLLLTLLQIEEVYFNQSKLIYDKNVLVICDRGTLDPSAYMDNAAWERVLKETKLDMFDLRDNRYNQIVHMVTAADGASKYYTCDNNKARSESMHEALKQDRRTREAWVGHQCLTIVDNQDCRNFNDKINKLIKVVSERLGISFEDRLAKNSKKRKWLVSEVIDEKAFRKNKFEEFSVEHKYIMSGNKHHQIRLRSRRQNGRTTYTLTTRRYEAADGTRLPEPVETRKQLTRREYNQYLSLCDNSRLTVHKKRRCFVYGNVYFHLDIYVEPLPPACNGQPLMILETYTTRPVGDPEPKLPPFFRIQKEITGEPAYSMFNLAGRESNPLTSISSKNETNKNSIVGNENAS